jgi:DNA invertase Pin-like site-specific DNA recombinase
MEFKSMQRIALYARDSHLKSAQEQLSQLRMLTEGRGLKVVSQFVDTGDQCLLSGTSKLSGLTALLKSAREGIFTSLLVWDISVLGNSMPDLIKTLQELQSLEVGVEFVQQGISTSNIDGAVISNFVVALAHYERTLKSEKIRTGQRRAAAAGRTTGRPTNMTPSVITAIQLLHSSGFGKKKIARHLRVGVGSVIAAL